jgi:hypothetical protein
MTNSINVKMRGTDNFTITVGSELFSVLKAFNYPEQCREPLWFVYRKDPMGWSELKSFDLSELNEALYFVTNFSDEA